MTGVLVAVTLLCIALQAYHYAGYPIILFLLQRIGRRPAAPESAGSAAPPRVSLIVSAFNERSVIEAKIVNSLDIDYPDLEIIVVADGSSDGTEQVVAQYSRSGVVGLFDPVRRGKGSAMTRGAAAARGDILIFSDANAFYESSAVRRLVGAFAEPRVGCVSGRKVVQTVDARGADAALGHTDGLYWRYESLIRRWESEIGSTVSVVGEMLAIRRSLFAGIPPGIVNDDAYLGLHVLRAGYRVVYEPGAVCREYPSGSMRDEAERRCRMTAGRYQLLMNPANWPWRQPRVVWQIASHKLLRLLLPFLMIGAFAANAGLLAAPSMPPAMLGLLVLQVAFYAAAGVGWIGSLTGRKWRVPHLAFYLTAANLSALVGLMRHVRGKQGALWTKAHRDALPPTQRHRASEGRTATVRTTAVRKRG